MKKNSPVRALLVDHDPISRHVVGTVLGQGEAVSLVATAEGPDQIRTWGSERADVVVFCAPPDSQAIAHVREIAGRGLAVLLVGTGWTGESVSEALAAGVRGCLVKNIRIDTIATAVVAAGSGHLILSPELHRLYRPAEAGQAGVKPGALSREQMVRSLTERELEVLTLLSAGNTTAEVAAALHVSSATVKSHVSHSLTKLGVRNRVEAVLMVRSVVGH
ncbi:LuxR C-terminal-related transcriptional regulator [Lentzea sp. NPDC058436]|uniref:response regulator transcription factor n=1 Tax=Lentzea sp. NPDC058436 TaxID=3346499 RepID=UPI003654F0B0